MKDLIVPEVIEQKIFFIRGQKVMLDIDLAALYGVPTFRLNEAVKRNKKRFPEDFMFRLTREENKSLTSQFAISNKGRGGRRTLPYAFTEHGILMLSSVLNSDRAIQVNIQLMRTFIKMREMLSVHKDILRRLNEMEKNYDRQFRIVFDTIRELSTPPKKSDLPAGRQGIKIGFKP